MSFTTWHNYGYGIKTSGITIESPERLKALVSLAPRYEADINKWFEENKIDEPAVDDYFEFDQDYMLGLATLLKEVIEETEGIKFTACDDFDGANYLLYAPLFRCNVPRCGRGGKIRV